MDLFYIVLAIFVIVTLLQAWSEIRTDRAIAEIWRKCARDLQGDIHKWAASDRKLSDLLEKLGGELLRGGDHS